MRDSKVENITLEGSGSLFTPLLHLIKDKGLKGDLEISILPTGSSGGRESLESSKIEIALASLSSEKNFSNNQANAQKIQEIKLAEDPIVFLHRADFKCKHLLRNGTDSKSSENRKEITELLTNGEKCDNLTLFVREGGKERSNLNKAVFKSDIQNSPKINIRELPENNFLALQFFQREEDANSLFYLPKSFYELNKEYLVNYKIFEPLEDNSSESQNSSSTQQSTTDYSPSYKKELQLLIDKSRKLKNTELLKKLLLNASSLSSLRLKAQNYSDSKSKNNNATKDIDEILKNISSSS